MATVSPSGTLSVGGLASGLDTNSIIDGLVAVEQTRVTNEQNQQSAYQLKLNTFNQLVSQISALSTQATALNDVNAFNLFNSTSSDNTVATIDGTTDASPGSYTVTVQSLASSLSVASKSFASQTSALGLSGTFSVSVSQAALQADPSTTSVQVSISPNDALKDIVNKINSASGTGASASIIQLGTNDYRLMLSSVDQGTQAFTLNPVGGSTTLNAGLGLTTDTQSLRTDTSFQLAGGGPAQSTTTLDQIFKGIGQQYQTGDVISWTGTDSSGNAHTNSYTIGDASTDTLGDLMTAMQSSFNESTPGQVSISANSSGEIVVKDNASGGAKNMTLSLSVNGTPTMTGQTQTDFQSAISTGQRAFYLLNGLPVAAQSNTDQTTVVGTKIQLIKASPGEPVDLTLNRDQSKIQQTVQTFVDAYNSVMSFIDTNSQITTSQNSNSSASSTTPAPVNGQTQTQLGPFAGDSSIEGLKEQLQNLVTNPIRELNSQGLSDYSSFASIGITTDAESDQLSIDSTQFTTALNTDFQGVVRLFTTSGYSNNPDLTYGTSTDNTQTGVYNINTATNQIDTLSGASSVSYATGTLTGDGNILNSNSGNSNGLAVQFSAATTGQITFIRGIAGQVETWNNQINDYVNGFVTNEQTSLNSSINDEATKITQLQSQSDAYRAQLVQQFANMEQTISQLQSQSSAFQNSGIH